MATPAERKLAEIEELYAATTASPVPSMPSFWAAPGDPVADVARGQVVQFFWPMSVNELATALGAGTTRTAVL
jgi:hypothetical protein